jgi:hypothetical protein
MAREEEILDLAQSILDVHARVQMDTPADKALHASVVDTFQTALDTERRLLQGKGESDG